MTLANEIKSKPTKAPLPDGVREYLRTIASRGGKAGSPEDKAKAARAAWAGPNRPGKKAKPKVPAAPTPRLINPTAQRRTKPTNSPVMQPSEDFDAVLAALRTDDWTLSDK